MSDENNRFEVIDDVEKINKILKLIDLSELKKETRYLTVTIYLK